MKSSSKLISRSLDRVLRAFVVEMESKKKNARNQPKERIIPIKLEGSDEECNVSSTTSEDILSQPISGSSMLCMAPDSQEILLSEDESPSFNGHDDETEKKHDSFSCDIPFEPVTVPEKTRPSFNVPEKIIIVLDSVFDEASTSFETLNGKKFSPLCMLKNVLQIFLHNKSFINKNHQYALVVLNRNSAQWIRNFTTSIKDIISSMETVEDCEPEDIFDLSCLFDLIDSHIQIPPITDIRPAAVYRTILTYNRSYSIPQLDSTPSISELLRSPHFTVDVVMTHENPDSGNYCEIIFKVLENIDPKHTGYSFSVARNSRELHNAMAELLAHPLQRLPQSDTNYKIK